MAPTIQHRCDLIPGEIQKSWDEFPQADVEQQLTRSKDGGAVIHLTLQRQGVTLLRLRW